MKLKIPSKENQIDIVVALGEKIAQNSGRIAASNLSRRVAKVDTFHKVPHLSSSILRERSI